MVKGIVTENLLPLEGESFYFPNFISSEKAQSYFEFILKETSWREEKIKLFGREIMQPRKIAWVGDPGVTIRYSGLILQPEPWSASLQEIRELLQDSCKEKFNGVLINLYRNQNDSMGWHSDDEKELGSKPIIASLSLGETREFQLKHKTESRLKVKINLEHGSLLLMKGETQKFWKHSLPKKTRPLGPRINLTFRKMLF